MATESDIQRELSRMDGGLFLDKEADRYGRIYYSVKHSVEGAVVPYTALKWIYPDGNPIPLSEDLLIALRSQEGDIREATAQAIANNAAKKELERQNAHKTADEVAKEWDDYKRGRKHISTGPGSIDHKTALNKRDI